MAASLMAGLSSESSTMAWPTVRAVSNPHNNQSTAGIGLPPTQHKNFITGPAGGKCMQNTKDTRTNTQNIAPKKAVIPTHYHQTVRESQ